MQAFTSVSIELDSKDLFSAIQKISNDIHNLKIKPKNIVLDTWVDYQPLINGKTLVWYYCDVLDEIQTKVI